MAYIADRGTRLRVQGAEAENRRNAARQRSLEERIAKLEERVAELELRTALDTPTSDEGER